MIKFYPVVLGIVDILNEWNEKLNGFADEHMGSVGVGTLLFFALLGLGFYGISTFNKKQ